MKLKHLEFPFIAERTSELSYEIAMSRGWRASMEDSYILRHCKLVDNEDAYFCGVYDGHGGNKVSTFVRDFIFGYFITSRYYQKRNYTEALRDAYIAIDEALFHYKKDTLSEIVKLGRTLPRNSPLACTGHGTKKGTTNCYHSNTDMTHYSHNQMSPLIPGFRLSFCYRDFTTRLRYKKVVRAAQASGTTACTVVVSGKKLYVANSGDSRCVLSRSGIAIDVTLDHTPMLETEHNRIVRGGGFIINGRIAGVLNLSRALGDMEFKDPRLDPENRILSCVPDVSEISLTEEDEFVIVASDGMWEVETSQTIVDYIRNRKIAGHHVVLSELFRRLQSPLPHNNPHGSDNITCIIVFFREFLAKRSC